MYLFIFIYITPLLPFVNLLLIGLPGRDCYLAIRPPIVLDIAILIRPLIVLDSCFLCYFVFILFYVQLCMYVCMMMVCVQIRTAASWSGAAGRGRGACRTARSCCTRCSNEASWAASSAPPTCPTTSWYVTQWGSTGVNLLSPLAFIYCAVVETCNSVSYTESSTIFVSFVTLLALK
jgi:hypothetical protein